MLNLTRYHVSMCLLFGTEKKPENRGESTMDVRKQGSPEAEFQGYVLLYGVLFHFQSWCFV